MTESALFDLKPGSVEAKAHGCRCTVRLEQYTDQETGEICEEKIFIINQMCPLHWHIHISELMKKNSQDFFEMNNFIRHMLICALICIFSLCLFFIFR